MGQHWERYQNRRNGARTVYQSEQLPLFLNEAQRSFSLPVHAPARPRGFQIMRIVLCRGSLDTEERETFVRRICALYPHVPVEERLATPHNRVEVEGDNPAQRLARGRRTLVFGAPSPGRVVRMNQRPNVIFPYRQSFSVYGFCPYGCRYCYMTSSPGVWFSPTVKIYVNLPEILAEVSRQANGLTRPTVFCLGKFEDGLALDPLTSYAQALVSFCARHRYARLFIQTKSDGVEHLLTAEHAGRTTLSWTITPGEIAGRFEGKAPSVEERLRAMSECSKRGYSVQANITPVIPYGNWEESYVELVRRLVEHVPLDKLTVGGVRLDTRSRFLLENTMGVDNAISRHLPRAPDTEDGHFFYKPGTLRGLFARMIREVQEIRRCVVRHETYHKRPHLVLEFARNHQSGRATH